MTIHRPAGFLCALGIAVLANVPAAQATPTASQILSTFNLVTTGNVTTGQDIEGSAVVGGNLNGNGTFFNNNVPANPVVYLYGHENGNYTLDAGGNLYYSGAIGGSVNYNGGALIASGPPQPLATYTAPLTQLSTGLAALTANSTISTANNTATFNAVGGSGGTAVFSLTGAALTADLGAVSNIAFNLDASVTAAIIDVFATPGNTTFTEPGGINWNGSPLQDVLFNFVGFTSVRVGNWQGSILAPGADVSISNGALNGSVFAGSFSGGGELHNTPFNGTLPPVVPVPEPPAAMVFALAITALACATVRRAIPSRRTVPETV